MAKKRNDSCADSAADGGSHGAEARVRGAPPSNTAPHNCNWTDDVVVLRSGVDTLQLSFRGELYDEWQVRLSELKRLAQSENASEKTYAQVEVSGHVFKVLPRGSGLFPYVLVDPWYRISLCDGKKSLPVAFVQISSEVLTNIGADAAEIELRSVLSEFVSASEGPTIGRIDCCVDFSTNFKFESINRQEWVTRARNSTQHVENNQFTGWTVGLKGNIAARLYDKTAEILVSNKPYFFDTWEACGWDGETPVWRLEFEVKREALRKFDATRLDHPVTLCAGLWPYLTESWLRLAIPSENDTTRSRWPTHPLWAALQRVNFDCPDVEPLRSVSVRGAPSRDWMFRSGASGILTFMALEGIDDFVEGVNLYFQGYLSYLDESADFRGRSSEDHIDMKLREIRRRYNLEFNQRPVSQIDPVAEAVARHYRKGRDGE